MKATSQKQQADKFHSFHHEDHPLILANAWDSASAKIFEQAGFPAIATTSSGISWSCGYKDGEHLPPELMIKAIARITNSVSVPVSADIEGGYFGDHKSFKKFFIDLMEAGAVGINLEDSHSQNDKLDEIKKQTKKIEIIRYLADREGIPLFINARTDAMEKTSGNLQTKIRECITRAKAFENAGANGIFIPFVKELETVALLKENIQLPLNILFTDSLPVSDLKRLRVNRISTGSRPILATLSLLKKVAKELLETSDWSALQPHDTHYPEMNALF